MKDILIIEDDVAIAGMLSDLLQTLDYEVRVAANGQEGVALLNQRVPDLILCDVMMPILDGRAVCRHVQSTPRFQSIPLVMMSAGRVDLSECAFTNFLAKPFDVPRLLDLVISLIGPA